MKGKDNQRLWAVAKWCIDTLSVHVGVFFEELKKSSKSFRLGIKTISGIWEIVKFVYTTLSNIVSNAVNLANIVVDTVVDNLTIIVPKIAQKLSETPERIKSGFKTVTEKLGGLLSLKNLLSPFSSISSMRKLLGRGNYNAITVCSILGISMMELKQMKNQDVVSFVMNNDNMNELHTYLVVCELNKELQSKRVFRLKNKCLLKF